MFRSILGFRSGKFREKWSKTQKSTNNHLLSFGLNRINMELSHIYLAGNVVIRLEIIFGHIVKELRMRP